MNYQSPSVKLKEIASCILLWQEYIDPMMVFTQEEFDKLTIEERLKIIKETFPESIPYSLWAKWFDGRCSIATLPHDCVQDCTRSGPADNAVEYWIKELKLEAPPWLLRQYLKGTGAYDSAELCDHQKNLRRLLWLWALECRDANESVEMYLDY